MNSCVILCVLDPAVDFVRSLTKAYDCEQITKCRRAIGVHSNVCISIDSRCT